VQTVPLAEIPKKNKLFITVSTHNKLTHISSEEPNTYISKLFLFFIKFDFLSRCRLSCRYHTSSAIIRRCSSCSTAVIWTATCHSLSCTSRKVSYMLHHCIDCLLLCCWLICVMSSIERRRVVSVLIQAQVSLKIPEA